MALFSPNKRGIPQQSEEELRQALIEQMVLQLGYPRALLAVEKKISQLPHLAFFPEKLPNRRVDILAYAVDKEKKLHPLLLIECKKECFSFKETQQLFGYNYYVEAPFIALVARKKTAFFSCTDSKVVQNILPSYDSLLQKVAHDSTLYKVELVGPEKA
jgi:hypothetical protein